MTGTPVVSGTVLGNIIYVDMGHKPSISYCMKGYQDTHNLVVDFPQRYS